MKKKVRKTLSIIFFVMIGLLIGCIGFAYAKIQTKALPEVYEDPYPDSMYVCHAYSDMVYNVIVSEQVFSLCRIEGYKFKTGEEHYQLHYNWLHPIYLPKPDTICFYRPNGDSILYDNTAQDTYLNTPPFEVLQAHKPVHLQFRYAADLEELLAEPIAAVGVNTHLHGIVKHNVRPEMVGLLRLRYDAVNKHLDTK